MEQEEAMDYSEYLSRRGVDEAVLGDTVDYSSLHREVIDPVRMAALQREQLAWAVMPLDTFEREVVDTLIEHQRRFVREFQNAEESDNSYAVVRTYIAAELGTKLVHSVLVWLERNDHPSGDD